MARNRGSNAAWLLAAGILAGAAAVAFISYRNSRRKGQGPRAFRPIENEVIRTLKGDMVLRERGIDVAMIAPGIVELTGAVESAAEGRHAVDVVQRVPGVRTVLNRLDLSGGRQQRLRRRLAGESEMGSGSRWYGMSVGMGRRRQGGRTDPDQRDDHAEMIDDALQPDAEEALADVVQERIESSARANEVS
jgi:hypothetical protein